MDRAALSASDDQCIALRFRYDRALLARVKAIPGRVWSAQQRAWLLPATPATATALARIFGPGLDARAIPPGHPFAILLTRWPTPSDSDKETGESTCASGGVASAAGGAAPARARALDRVPREAAPGPPAQPIAPALTECLNAELRLRGYSPRTCKAYVAHVRRFLAEAGDGGGCRTGRPPQPGVHPRFPPAARRAAVELRPSAGRQRAALSPPRGAPARRSARSGPTRASSGSYRACWRRRR